MITPKVKDFERLLRLWKKFYIPNDAFYLKIFGELNSNIDPVKAYARIFG